MLEPAELPLGSAGYRALGLIANPFRSLSWHPSDKSVNELLTHAAASRCSAAVDCSLSSGNSEPVWLAGDADYGGHYRRLAVSEVVYSMTENKAFNAFVVNVPFPMLSNGRIRSALGIVAERLAGESFGKTLGMYAAVAFREFDGGLVEAAALTAGEVEELRARFEQDPDGTASDVFGEALSERDPDADVTVMMRETSLRQNKLEVDPEESEEDPEADATPEPLESEATLEPSESEAAALDQAAADEGADQLRLRAREYVIAFLRAHLSPVLARGVAAYVKAGTDRLGQELKITKAPRKTLRALCEFAAFRYRGTVILYDDFDSWNLVPIELRARICASMTELRLLLKPMAVLAFAAGAGEVPELEEQFSSVHVDWRMVPLLEGLSHDVETDTVMELLRWSALPGGPDSSVVERVQGFRDETGGDLERFVLASGAWLDARAKEAGG